MKPVALCQYKLMQECYIRKRILKLHRDVRYQTQGGLHLTTKMKLIQATLRCAKVLPAITAKDDPLANEINSRSVFVLVHNLTTEH